MTKPPECKMAKSVEGLVLKKRKWYSNQDKENKNNNRDNKQNNRN